LFAHVATSSPAFGFYQDALMQDVVHGRVKMESDPGLQAEYSL